jgi:hypothetical protein
MGVPEYIECMLAMDASGRAEAERVFLGHALLKRT